MNALRFTSRRLLALQGLFLLGIVLAVAAPAARFVERAWAKHESAARWSQWKAESSASTSPPTTGDPAAWLTIPSVEVDTLVLQDASKDNLARLPCVHTSSLIPGAPKVIMAHRDTHFRNLQQLKLGDQVFVESETGARIRYRVSNSTIVAPERIPDALAEIQSGSMVLMTCWPFDIVGPAPKRILFQAIPE